MKAGLSCIPSDPRLTEEQSHCALNNTYMMLKGLLEMVQDFPAKKVCVEESTRWITRQVDEKYPRPPQPRGFGRLPMRGKGKKRHGPASRLPRRGERPSAPKTETVPEKYCKRHETIGKDFSRSDLIKYVGQFCTPECK